MFSPPPHCKKKRDMEFESKKKDDYYVVHTVGIYKTYPEMLQAVGNFRRAFPNRSPLFRRFYDANTAEHFLEFGVLPIHKHFFETDHIFVNIIDEYSYSYVFRESTQKSMQSGSSSNRRKFPDQLKQIVFASASEKATMQLASLHALMQILISMSNNDYRNAFVKIHFNYSYVCERFPSWSSKKKSKERDSEHKCAVASIVEDMLNALKRDRDMTIELEFHGFQQKKDRCGIEAFCVLKENTKYFLSQE